MQWPPHKENTNVHHHFNFKFGGGPGIIIGKPTSIAHIILKKEAEEEGAKLKRRLLSILISPRQAAEPGCWLVQPARTDNCFASNSLPQWLLNYLQIITLILFSV